MHIKGKTVLITGAARRLGAAAAESLAAEGCSILLHYHTAEKQAMETAGHIEAAGSSVYLLRQDLSQPDSASELFEKIKSLEIIPDILINSAGSYPGSDFNSLQWTDTEAAFLLNAYTPFALAREFSRFDEAACILNILDARMVDYDRQHLAYHLSKRLLHDLTRILSIELAPRIRVNGIAPGIILPDRPDDPEVLEKYRRGNLLERLGSVDDYLRTVHFLLASDFITGQIIFVDGGRHLRGRVYGS